TDPGNQAIDTDHTISSIAVHCTWVTDGRSAFVATNTMGTCDEAMTLYAVGEIGELIR
ncbi:hypothetical protein SARC_15301, partial [Sphaeroforma arctica JP610]